MVSEKVVEGYRIINFTPDMDENERERAEKEIVRNILREYNQLEDKSKLVQK